jgi:hypothetical protein
MLFSIHDLADLKNYEFVKLQLSAVMIGKGRRSQKDTAPRMKIA